MTDMQTWERKYFSPGGGDAFLFYVIFGKFAQPFELSRSQYRTNGVPSALEVGSHARWMDNPMLRSFVGGYLGDRLKEDGALYNAIVSSPECITVRGTIADPPDLDYLRDTVGFISALLDQGGVGVYDPQRFAWWSPASWAQQIFEPNAAAPQHHCIILISEDGDSRDLKWVHTRGLRKFGRPDISVRGVPRESLDAAITLCDRFVEHQAFGLIVAEGQQINMEGLPPGLVCRHAGDLDDPDFNNVHFEIRFPN
jgi:hypothetical protein